MGTAGSSPRILTAGLLPSVGSGISGSTALSSRGKSAAFGSLVSVGQQLLNEYHSVKGYDLWKTAAGGSFCWGQEQRGWSPHCQLLSASH